MRVVDQANMDLGVLFDMNLTGGVYTCHSSGYNMIESEATIKHQGGDSALLLKLTPLENRISSVLWTPRPQIPYVIGSEAVVCNWVIRPACQHDRY